MTARGQNLVRDALRELPWTEPKTTDNRDELKLQRNNARILFDSAEHGHPFRGETVRIAHCTETSIWEDVFKALAALNNAVPEQPGTVLAQESTANGIGNPFHEMWEKACKGDGNLMPYFFPWWIDPEFDYVAKITETERQEILHTKDDEEKSLLFDGFDIGGDTVFCTPEQVAWRRRAIIDKCMGDPDQFRQEYPSNPDEAFLKPGRSLFAPAVVKKHLAHCEEPNICTITYRKPGSPGGRGFPLSRLRYDIEHNSHGKFSIWKKPNPKYNYVIACDSSEGVGQDNTAIMVMCVQTRELVASWVDCDTQPYQAGLILACIGHFYQGAFLWPESNSPGPAVIQALRDVAYPLIGMTPSLEEGTVVNHGRLGWRSTQKSRPLAMNELRNAMREDSIRIRCRQTLLEANSMYIDKTSAGNDTYKYPKGGRIDRVDSLAVALFACRFVQDYDVFEVPNQQIRLTYDEEHWQEYREMVEPAPETDLEPLPGYEGSHAWDPKDRESFTL